MIKGIHHVSMKCSKGEEFAKVVKFYSETLGLCIAQTWGDEENPDGILFDAGDGMIEIFTNRNEVCETGIIRHFALETDDVDKCIDGVKKAGYEVFIEPKNISVPFSARIAFCFGPLGEQIEFIHLN